MPCGFVDYPNKQFTQKQQAKPKYTPTRPGRRPRRRRAWRICSSKLCPSRHFCRAWAPCSASHGLGSGCRPGAWGLGAKRHLALVSRRDVFKSGSVEEVVDLRCFKRNRRYWSVSWLHVASNIASRQPASAGPPVSFAAFRFCLPQGEI